MKKILLVILAVCLVIITVTPLFLDWIYKFAIKTRNIEFSQLQFTSIEGDYLIFIDGRKIGKVENKNTKVFPKIESGERVIKISRSSKDGNLYFTLERKVNFYPRTQTEIIWSAGPTLESSEGVIKYFGLSSNPEGTRVVVHTFPSFAKVLLNDLEIGKEFIIDNVATNKIFVYAGDSYHPKEIEIRLKDNSTNTVPVNISLNIDVYLYRKPF